MTKQMTRCCWFYFVVFFTVRLLETISEITNQVISSTVVDMWTNIPWDEWSVFSVRGSLLAFLCGHTKYQFQVFLDFFSFFFHFDYFPIIIHL